MSRPITVRPQARRDLADIAATIAADRPRVANLFLDAFGATARLLSSVPSYGAPCPTSRAELAGLRICTIPRYRNYVVLYRALDAEVEIVRVVHGARDLGAVVEDVE